MSKQSLETVTLPRLDDPAAFDVWKREVMRDQTRIEPAVKALEQAGDLGVVRAAMLLVGAAPDRARAYATQALGSDDIRIHLLAEAYLAVLQVHVAWTGHATPKFDARSAPIVLERILAETKCLRDYSAFGREVVMRVHHLLADAYVLSGAMDRVREHAAEMSHVAFSLDLPATQLAANYYLAQVAEAEGQPGLAEDLYRGVAEDPNAGFLGPRANRARAGLLIRMGDEDGADALLDPTDCATGTPPFHLTVGLRFLTLREPLTPDVESGLSLIPANAAALVSVYAAMTQALGCEPDDDLTRMKHWGRAHERLRAFDASITKESMKLEARVRSAFVLLQMRQVAQALHRLPRPEDVANQPAGIRALAHVTSIEVLERLLPESADALLEVINCAAHDLYQLEERILVQVVRHLRLIAPRALALLALSPFTAGAARGKHQAIDDFERVAREAIMNVHARPVIVYGRQFLRPVQAAWFTLEAFDLPCAHLELYEGGGQRQALRQGLFLAYHRHTCWHWPVAPARIAFALMCCARSNPRNVALRRAVRDLRQSYGLVSPQMLEADKSGALRRTEHALAQLEAGRITPEHAHRAIQGE